MITFPTSILRATCIVAIATLPLLVACKSGSNVTTSERQTVPTAATGSSIGGAPMPPQVAQGTLPTDADQAPPYFPNVPSDADTVVTISGLKYVEHQIGTGAEVKKGMKVKVDYAGYLLSGKLFDTSIRSIGQENNFDRGGYPFQPLELTVGTGQVIRGWDEGLTTNMRVGGSRRLIIPANLGYGPQGMRPSIPPNATLVFDVKVLEAK